MDGAGGRKSHKFRGAVQAEILTTLYRVQNWQSSRLYGHGNKEYARARTDLITIFF